MFRKTKIEVLTPAIVLWVLLLSIAFAASVFAHGKENHAERSAVDKHMQAMMAVKEKIPEEYRLMERTPVLPDEASLARGNTLFAKHCAACHGEKGDGKGPAAAALPTPPANFLDTGHSGMYNPGEKYWIVGNGTGETGMPGFPQLPPKDRWHLVNYILSLQKPAETSSRHGSH